MFARRSCYGMNAEQLLEHGAISLTKMFNDPLNPVIGKMRRDETVYDLTRPGELNLRLWVGSVSRKPTVDLRFSRYVDLRESNFSYDDPHLYLSGPLNALSDPLDIESTISRVESRGRDGIRLVISGSYNSDTFNDVSLVLSLADNMSRLFGKMKPFRPGRRSL